MEKKGVEAVSKEAAFFWLRGIFPTSGQADFRTKQRERKAAMKLFRRKLCKWYEQAVRNGKVKIKSA